MSRPTSLAFGNGRFVVAYRNGVVAWSEDGINWTRSTNSAGVIPHIILHLDYFYAVSQNGMARSRDGVVWQDLETPNHLPSFGAVVTDKSFIVTTSTNINFPQVQTSLDGYDNELFDLPRATDEPTATGSALAYGDGHFWFSYTVDRGDEIKKRFARSQDGMRWIETYVQFPPNEITTVAYGNGHLIVGSHDRFAMLPAYNETATYAPKPREAWHNLIFAGGRFFASATLAWSLDGKEWHDMEFPGQTQAIRGVAYGNGRYVAVGEYTGSPSPDTDIVAVWETERPAIITQHPEGSKVAQGRSAALTLEYEASVPATFQWIKNGEPIPGATQQTLIIKSFAFEDFGLYSCKVSAHGLPISTKSTRFESARDRDANRLINLSVRAEVGGPSDPLITGFVVGGTSGGSEGELMFRSVGPSLREFGVTDPVADPFMDIFTNVSTKVGTYDNWGGSTPESEFTRLGAFPLESSDSLDASVTLRSFPAGVHSVHHRSANSNGGVLLGEIYDASIGSAVRGGVLTNLSCRTTVSAGGDGITVGFVIRGQTRQGVLIRAVGPGLADYGVAEPLPNPVLRLFSHEYSQPYYLRQNSQWSDEYRSIHQEVGAFNLTPGSNDAAIVAFLPAGVYSARVDADPAVDGAVLVELYEIP